MTTGATGAKGWSPPPDDAVCARREASVRACSPGGNRERGSTRGGALRAPIMAPSKGGRGRGRPPKHATLFQADGLIAAPGLSSNEWRGSTRSSSGPLGYTPGSLGGRCASGSRGVAGFFCGCLRDNLSLAAASLALIYERPVAPCSGMAFALPRFLARFALCLTLCQQARRTKAVIVEQTQQTTESSSAMTVNVGGKAAVSAGGEHGGGVVGKGGGATGGVGGEGGKGVDGGGDGHG